MYSRKYYDRTKNTSQNQQSTYGYRSWKRPAPYGETYENKPEKNEIQIKNGNSEIDEKVSQTETFSLFPLDKGDLSEISNSLQGEPILPRDFSPMRENTPYFATETVTSDSEILPETEENGDKETETAEEAFETTEISEISEESETETPKNSENLLENIISLKFEDMLLTGLLLLGGSGNYDDEIMLIMGLVLMIGI